ncbi:MAG: T9SS type A sorting domain-containing protein [Bacteroidetes bacterium]|nr:MAG: T9SS type A sorting domain-containing protein [Bacteroidota bacterium]
MKSLIVSILLLFSIQNFTFADENCLQLVFPHQPDSLINNPDSVMVDTCDGYFYTKKWFFVLLPVNSLNIPQAPPDSILEVGWDDIDTNFQSLRDGFEELENKFGMFTLRKQVPEMSDSNAIGSRVFMIRFNNYVRIDSVYYTLKSISGIQDCYYINAMAIFQSNMNEPGFQMGEMENNPIKSKLFNFWYSYNYHSRSSQWNLLSIHIPLAWEITKGRKNENDISDNICINIRDDFKEHKWIDDNGNVIDRKNASEMNINDYNLIEPKHGIGYGIAQNTPSDGIERTGDLYMKIYRETHQTDDGIDYTNGYINNTTNGNVIYNETWVQNESKYYPFSGTDGIVKSLRIHYCHGLGALSMINSKLTVDPKGISGSCPNCYAICTETYQDPTYFDIYPNLTEKQAPNITSSSSLNLPMSSSNSEEEKENFKILSQTYLNSLKAGIIAVTLNGPCFDNFIKTDDDNGVKDYTDCTEESFLTDLKTIDVWVMEDGLPHNPSIDFLLQENYKPCVPWDPRIIVENPNYPNQKLTYWNGIERVDDFYLDDNDGISDNALRPWKFLKGKDPIGRWRKTQGAHDIVAPGAVIYGHHNGEYLSSGGSAPSYAVPTVAGVVGLMLSIDKTLNQTAESAWIHRKAFDITTFTADKIICKWDYWDNNWPDESYRVTNLGSYDYKEPWDNDRSIWIDPLKRWWSPNAAYGEINAFRCVAHAIRKKGQNVYTGSGNQTLPFEEGVGNINEDSKKLMHFGAYNLTGNLVLENGGDKYMGDNNWNNCQGTTKINGGDATNGPLNLIVPNNCILAIDGILTQTQMPNKYNNKIFTSDNGKILMTGFLNDVELDGLVKTSNVKVYSSDNDGLGRITFKACSTDSPEIYDSLIINGKSQVIFYSGTSTLMPGSVIYLKGDNDLIIEDGATLIMDYNSAIISDDSKPRQIIVKPGGTLKIKEGAVAEIKCKVILEYNQWSASSFLVDKNVLLKLKEFSFEEGSSFTIKEGCWISLTKKTVNICKGEFEVQGEVNNPIIFSGNTSYCPDCTTKIKTIDYATIHIIGHTQSYNINYTNFDNVLLKITPDNQSSICHTLFNCQFSANAEILKNSSNKTLLEIVNYSRYAKGDMIQNCGRFSIEECKFIDYDNGVLQGNKRIKIIKGFITSYPIYEIKKSIFNGLQFGVSIDFIPIGKYQSSSLTNLNENTFLNCDVAFQNEQFVKSILDDNDFTNINYGCVYNGSLSGQLLKNYYKDNYHGIRSLNSGIQYLCKNTFENFSRGIYCEQSGMELGPIKSINDQNNQTWYGKNKFYFTNPLLFDDKTDIELYKDGWVNVYKGRNLFSFNSLYHIESTVNTHEIKILADKNKWLNDENGNCEIRSSGVTILESYNICDDFTENNCLMDYESEISSAVIDTCIGIYGYLVDGHYVWNDGHWVDTTFTHDEWQDIINQAIDYLGDSLYINCKCKIQIYQDLMEAITLSNDQSDSTYQKLQDLYAHIKYWCNNEKYSWIIFGLLFEYFDKLDDAEDIYSDIISNYTEFTLDSIIANWRLLKLNAIRSDTTYGSLYDSLISIYYDRILFDLNRFPYQFSDSLIHRDSAHYQRPQDVTWEWEEHAKLGQNIPNPFSDETEIPYYLKKPTFVKLVVYDAFGREIAVLVNEYRQPGKHTAIYRSPDLYNGVYFYRLEAGGIIETRKMQLIK